MAMAVSVSIDSAYFVGACQPNNLGRFNRYQYDSIEHALVFVLLFFAAFQWHFFAPKNGVFFATRRMDILCGEVNADYSRRGRCPSVDVLLTQSTEETSAKSLRHRLRKSTLRVSPRKFCMGSCRKLQKLCDA